MSNRANTITVVLDKDYRHDDIEELVNAIKMLKGVLTAEPDVADISAYMAEARAINALTQKLREVLHPPK